MKQFGSTSCLSTLQGEQRITVQGLLRVQPFTLDPDLNVIVITGYPDSEMLDRILQVSPVTVLKKPLKIEQLNQTVKILDHSSARFES